MFYNIKTKNQGKKGGERMEWVHLIIYIRAHENGRYERGRFFNYRESSFSRQGRKFSEVGKNTRRRKKESQEGWKAKVRKKKKNGQLHIIYPYSMPTNRKNIATFAAIYLIRTN